MKRNIYINVGNSSTIIGRSKSDNIQDLEFQRIKTQDLLDGNVEKILNETLLQFDDAQNIQFAFISSVVNSLNEKFENFLKKHNIQYSFISCKDIPDIDLSNVYNKYEIGADILAQLSFVCNFFEEAIVVSAGTASVIYHVKDKKLSGCIILPGIKKSFDVIRSSTDISSFEISNTKDKLLGLNTSEAISIGVINAIELFVENLSKKLNTNCPIICTGGAYKVFNQRNAWWFIDYLEIMGLFTHVKNRLDKVVL